ncbi:hypothetical protein PTKU64_64230 [Paraburkholderia terrae]|uniref:Uncharacterized protein n=1 Tax=Paraburkholderia terrae TaxID=311230 RepID=A0ABM7TVJ2_9BURK|nr:hypothetical protein PTKU64_64230 [Paraburkholderia terrae]
MAPSIDNLFARASANAELQPSASYQIGCAGVFRHVERILVAHVDNTRSNLDRARPGADCGEKGKRRRKLLSEMMDAKEGTIRAECFGGDGEVDGLQKNIGCRPCL